MAKLSRVVGSTSNIVEVFVQNSSVTTGAGLAGLLFNSASLTGYYKRNKGTASVSITLATITTLGTFASGGFKEVDATNMPGVYEFHPPDAAFASGADSVVFILKGATNMAPVVLEIELTATNNQVADVAQTGDTYALANGASGFVAIAGYLDTEIANIQTRLPTALVGGKMDSTSVVTGTVVLTDGSLTDAKITFPDEAVGRPSAFMAAVRRIWEWRVNKRTRSRSSGNVVLYGADNTTVLETQNQSTAGTDDTQTKGA